MLYSLFIINKAGGLIFNVDLSAAVPKHSGNEYMRLASTFHGLFEISSEVAPLLSNGIEILDADTFRLQCLKTLTGTRHTPYRGKTRSPLPTPHLVLARMRR